MSEKYLKDIKDLYDDTDPKSIESYAQKLVGKTFRDVISEDMPSGVSDVGTSFSNPLRKGGLGNLLEEKYFHYESNSDPEPDFPKAGVELKVTPYEKKQNGKLSAGERLVLTMISYEKPVERSFFDSHLWHKCRQLLLIYYLRDRSLNINLDYIIDFAELFTPPQEDLDIIMQDYNTIIEKISAGKAHELSESDTMYLGACTKGSTALKSTVPQYYAPNVPARKRAFCYKTSYMTYVLNKYIVPGKEKYETIIKDETSLKSMTFEEFISSKINKYIGKTDKELCNLFDREYNNNKAQWIDLAYRMLGIKSNKAEEFVKANIVVKAIRIEENGKMRESSPLPPFSFKTVAKEEWENSDLYSYFAETKFFFVVFKKINDEYVLKGCQLWNMAYSDLNETVYEGWKAIKDVINNRVILTRKGKTIKNNFPKKGDNRIIHIRPHSRKSFYVFEDGSTFGSGDERDADELPDGRKMTKQSFWLNNSYILEQLEDRLKK